MKSVGINIVKKYLPKRKEDDNKTAGGKCLVIAGSDEMPGAARLTAKAATRMGAGYVYLAVDFKRKIRNIEPDFILVDINKKINFGDFSSIAIGPGLGKNKKIISILKKLKKSGAAHVVVDADALNALAKHPEVLPLPPTWVVTPHAGELSRLMGFKKSISPSERKKTLTESQNKIGCILLLKGHPTFVFDGANSFSVATGNKALAKAGTGDVLTGIIAGLLSQKIPPLKAALTGAVIHGLLADNWVKSKDYLSLMASDLIEEIPTTLFQIRK